MIPLAHKHFVGDPPERLTLGPVAPPNHGSPAARRSDRKILEAHDAYDGRDGNGSVGRRHGRHRTVSLPFTGRGNGRGGAYAPARKHFASTPQRVPFAEGHEP